MNSEEKEIRKKTFLIMAIVIVLLALVAVGYVIYHQRQQIQLEIGRASCRERV